MTPKYTNFEVGVRVIIFFVIIFQKVHFWPVVSKFLFIKKTQFFGQHFPKSAFLAGCFENPLQISFFQVSFFSVSLRYILFSNSQKLMFFNFRAVPPNNADDATMSQWQTWMIGQMARLRLVDVFHEKCHRVIDFSAIAADVIKESLRKPHHRLRVDVSVKKNKF